MIATWIGYGLLVGGLLVVATHAVARVCEIVGQPTRWLWIGALLLLAALMGVAPYRQAIFSHLKPGISDARALSSGQSVTNTARGEEDRDHLLVRGNLVIEGTRALLQRVITKTDYIIVLVGQRVPSHWNRSFGVVWGTLSLLLLGLFARVSWRLHRARSGWRAGELHDVPVLITSGIGPVVIGVFRPAIVVPHWLLDCHVEEQRLVLAHEREHVRAHDSLVLAVACFGVILLPWNPAAWWIFSRLRLAVELDCDRRVLRQGVAPRAYGAVLIDVARRCPRLAVNAPALADRASHLEQRILAMNPSRLPYPRLYSIAFSSIAGIALIVACVAETPVTEPKAKAASQSNIPSPAITAVNVNSVKKAAPKALSVSAMGTAALGQQRRVEVGNDIAAINANSVPGYEITHTSLTYRSRIRLRGVSSITGNNNPIVIVDGSRIDAQTSTQRTQNSTAKGSRSLPAPLDQLDPNNIETIKVFEGPSASAMYGADAANGVIVVTTKHRTP